MCLVTFWAWILGMLLNNFWWLDRWFPPVPCAWKKIWWIKTWLKWKETCLFTGGQWAPLRMLDEVSKAPDLNKGQKMEACFRRRLLVWKETSFFHWVFTRVADVFAFAFHFSESQNLACIRIAWGGVIKIHLLSPTLRNSDSFGCGM